MILSSMILSPFPELGVWCFEKLLFQITVPCGTVPFFGMITMPSRMKYRG